MGRIRPARVLRARCRTAVIARPVEPSSHHHALMATSNSPTCGHSNSPRHDPAVDGRRGCLFPGSSNRLLGQAERVRPEASAGERWSSYGPRRGRPQACPVDGWLVHRGRGLPPIRVGNFGGRHGHHATRPCQRLHLVIGGAVSAMHSTRFSAASISIFSASVLTPRRPFSLNLPKT